MSKKLTAASERHGISTPAILADAHQSGNTQSFSSAAFAEALETTIHNEAIGPLQTAADVFVWLSTLAAAIKDAAQEGLRPAKTSALAHPEVHALMRIGDLANIAKHLADDMGDRADSEKEGLRDEHLPRLLAALPNGGEA